MYLVNENLATRRIALRDREDDDPSNSVEDEVVVEFDEAGRAEVGAEVGAELIERCASIREADGPEDIAADYEDTDPWTGIEATDEAVELASEHDLEPGDIEGSGQGGRILVGDVRDTIGEA